MNDSLELMSPRQLAKVIGRDRSVVAEAIRTGELEVTRLPGRKRPLIRKAAAEQWLMARAERKLAAGRYLVGLLFVPHDGVPPQIVATIADAEIVAGIQRAVVALHDAGLVELRSPLAIPTLGNAAPRSAESERGGLAAARPERAGSGP